MNLFEWIRQHLLPLLVPSDVLDLTLFYVKNPNAEGVSAPVTVSTVIAWLYALLVGFCAVYALVWVPFRGILSIIRWKRWRGY